MKNDEKYREILLTPIRICAKYQPKMGQKTEMSMSDFCSLYRSDPFYHWLGLDIPLVYAAHKTAGGMTSIYRQIGIGCERLFRAILMDKLRLSPDEATWSYQTKSGSGKSRALHLDGRIPLDAIRQSRRRAIVSNWMQQSAKNVGVSKTIANSLTGIVFEIRQGYKSKDSKRQNADLFNASASYANAYLPCIAVFSGQIDGDVRARYQNQKWVLLSGKTEDTCPHTSLYVFMDEVIGYDMAGFFRRNTKKLRQELRQVLRSLLKP